MLEDPDGLLSVLEEDEREVAMLKLLLVKMQLRRIIRKLRDEGKDDEAAKVEKCCENRECLVAFAAEVEERAVPIDFWDSGYGDDDDGPILRMLKWLLDGDNLGKILSFITKIIALF
jgi:hypothetical protein